MGPQQRLGIYVGFDFLSIIRYLEPLTYDVFTTRFTDCHFNESVFPSLEREKSISEERQEITWNTSTTSYLDPHTNQCELEVQGSFIYKILQINCKMHSLIQRK